MQDLATQWIQAYPCKNKTSQETQRSLQKFLEPERKPKVIYTDNSLEFGKACEDLSWNHCTSTPHRSETNGIAERRRRVKEGTSAVLLQSGLNESWWADSMECFKYLRNVTDLLSDGKTPYERRFGKPFEGPIIPFGSLVEYHPITAKDQSRIHQFGKKVFTWIVPRIRSLRGEEFGRVTLLIADLEELETMDASKIYSKRLNAKEVIFPQKGEFIFPIADGRIKTSREDQELRTSTLIRPRPSRGEGHIDFLGESEGSFSTTSWLTSGCRWSYERLLVHVRKLHIPPSRWTTSRTLLAERRIIPYSTKVHWRYQNYSYEFGCQTREAHRWLLEQWWLSRLFWSLDGFHTF